MVVDEQTKQRLVAQLSDYLDDLEQTAPAEDGQDTRAVDLYTLFTELAGVRNEMRLESRQVKRALDEFGSVFTTLEASSQRLQSELDARREEQTAVTARTERPILLELIALRDRLEQARQLAAGHRPGTLARLFSRREHGLIYDLAEGLGITLRRLDQALAAYDVTPIDTIGHPIDPHIMRVAAARADASQANGVVLAENQRGYRRAGEVLRLAEVIVNKTEQAP